MANRSIDLKGLDRKTVLAGLLAAAGLIALAVAGRSALNDGGLGESRNPNFGHPTKPAGTRHAPAVDFNHLTEEQYYEGLKAQRPDLSEAELRAKADHWWKVRNGEAGVAPG